MPFDESQFASLKKEIEAFVRGPGEDYAEEIEPAWLDGATTVGVTSGASVRSR